MSYSVGQVAELTGVTIRTLHHYGQIGLLEPQERTSAGYRMYSDADLDRLRHILFYRELGFPLDQISAILDDSQGDGRGDGGNDGGSAAAHLRRQHELLTERIARLQEMVSAVERELEAHEMGIPLTPQEKFEIFGPSYSDDYESEAQERWGDTPAWQQSQSRTAHFTKQDWITVKHDGEDLNRRMAAAMLAGSAPNSAQAMDLAEEHHRSIEIFYDCPYAMHRGLGEMYLADERFTRTYEDVAPGLARWLRDAIHANADRQEVG